MTNRLEADVRAALTQAAQRVRVPGAKLPTSNSSARPDAVGHRRLPILYSLAASVAVIAVVAAAWALTTLRSPDDGSPVAPATGQTSNTPSTTADSQFAEAPSLALGSGTSIVTKGVVTDLGEPVVAIDSILGVSVARTSDGRVWQHSAKLGQATPIGRDASTGPILSVDGGSALWVENSTAGSVVVVHPLDAPETSSATRIALPDGASCCSAETVLGMDQHRVLYLGTENGVWMAYLGEGRAPDARWTPVSGLDDSRLAAVTADEVIVRHPQGGAAWGYVEPTTSEYFETARVAFADLWFLPRGVVARAENGQLVAVDSTIDTDTDSSGVVRPTHRLREPRFEFELPADAELNGVAHETNEDFLVDLTLSDGSRGWYRCTLTKPTCAFAAELESKDATPGSIG